MSYHFLYNMPCRLPYYRYSNNGNIENFKYNNPGLPVITEHFDGCRGCGGCKGCEACGWVNSCVGGYGCGCPRTFEGYDLNPPYGPVRPIKPATNCDCSVNNPPYVMDKCDYNQSPTWSDQSDFRKNIQNKY
jgi:hypothetical protein